MRRIPLFVLCQWPVVLSAQLPVAATTKIPVRQIVISAKSPDTLGTQVTVRVVSGGSVLVNDAMRRRVLLFGPQLNAPTVVIDSAASGGAFQRSAQLIRFTGDSTLLVDMSTQALLVLDASGKVARVMALPKLRDARFIGATVFGDARMDARGRLIYRGLYQLAPKVSERDGTTTVSVPTPPDSAPILRADFDTRSVDTITTLRIPQPESMSQTQDGLGNVTMKITVNPMGTGDAWAMLSDGAIAIVRVHDYHIDWIEPDGSRRATPKMPFDWRPITQEQKQFRLDSLRPILQKQVDEMPRQTTQTANGPRKLNVQFDFVPLADLPEFEPPVEQSSVKADLQGNLWIVPHTSASATGGLLYDVVNQRGEISCRVQFPKGYALVGFGNAADIYVLRVVGHAGFLEKAALK